MGDHPNAAQIRDRFAGGDLNEMLSWLADDVVWHQIGGGTLQGKDAVAESMSDVAEVDFDLALHDVVANDEHAVALMEVKIGAGEQSFGYRTAEIYHMSDGKITERWAFSDDTQAINDFFASLGG